MSSRRDFELAAFLVGCALIGYASNGWTGLMSTVGFGILGACLGTWSRRK